MSQNPFFSGGKLFRNSGLMDHGGLTCTLHMPKARESQFVNGEEVEQSLPEGSPRAAFLVDEYPAAPPDWMRSEPGTSSYMVPVKEGYGMWLDFNACARHTHDVAVVVSTQGINALTTMKTTVPKLVQYRAEGTCPLHKKPFVGNARCNDCGFEWSPQNYLATTGTPQGLFWLDGFRTADGTTRQWLFTAEEARGVAAAAIGKERVHAIGIAFFLSKEPKPIPTGRIRRGGGYDEPLDALDEVAECALPQCYGGSTDSISFGAEAKSSAPRKTLSARRGDDKLRSITPRTQLEIGAGAKIRQKVYADPMSLDYWQDTPAGIIVINYTDEETAREVIEAGRKTTEEGPLGALGVPVGHKLKKAQA